MFFKEFMEEVITVEKAGKFDDLPELDEVDTAKGEEFVRVIENPYIKALFTAFRKRLLVTREKIQERAISRMGGVEALQEIVGELKHLATLTKECDLLRKLTWGEIHLHLGLLDNPLLGMRRGWKVVRVGEGSEKSSTTKPVVTFITPFPPGIDGCGGRPVNPFL